MALMTTSSCGELTMTGSYGWRVGGAAVHATSPRVQFPQLQSGSGERHRRQVAVGRTHPQ